MNIDLGSFAFGTSLKVGSGTPSWGTALGQSSPNYRITRDGSDRILIGMLYCAIPKKDIKMPIGKGGHIVSGDQADEIQLAALFNTVYVNNIKIEYPFILVLQKEDSNSHPGRRSLKYSDKISYQSNGKTYSNNLFIKEVTQTLKLADNACWFAYKIDIENQDTLHISIIVVDKDKSIEYNNSEERKNKWTQLITEKDADILSAEFSPAKNTLYHPNNEIIKLLNEKRNVILTGAPGTGKTFTAKAIASYIVSDGKSDWKGLTEERKKQVGFVQFHPSYDYTDFVEGLRPIAGGEFRRQDGVFKAFCKRAISPTTNESSISCDVNPLIAKYLKPDMQIASSTGRTSYHIDKIDDTTIVLSGNTIQGYNIPVADVINAYKNRLWEKGKQSNGNDSYTAALAKHIYEQESSNTQQDKPAKNELSGDNKYVFIIDEINRGELSKIFGELFYAIEPDYRGKAGTVQTQYNNLVEDDDIFKPGFYIPENVYIIGTMNDIDRGVEAMDFAIRRRFAWKEVTAEESAENMGITGLALEKMKALNKALMANGLSKACCIGGAYFRKLKDNDYDLLWKYHLAGIVYEYFRGEPDAEEKLQAVKEAFEKANLPTSEETYNVQEETEEGLAE